MYLSEEELTSTSSPDWFSPQMERAGVFTREEIAPSVTSTPFPTEVMQTTMTTSHYPSLFRLMVPWTSTGRRAWTQLVLILHTNAVSSLRLKRVCVCLNASLAACQVITIAAELCGLIATPTRECYSAKWCLSGIYIVNLVVSISFLGAELLYWCFLYLPVLGHHDCHQPVATLFLEVISSLDFWVLAFAIASLTKHGLVSTTPLGLGSVIRHILICMAFLIIFVKYASRAHKDLHNHSAGEDQPEGSVWDDDTCLTDNRSVYWEHSSTNM